MSLVPVKDQHLAPFASDDERRRSLPIIERSQEQGINNGGGGGGAVAPAVFVLNQTLPSGNNAAAASQNRPGNPYESLSGFYPCLLCNMPVVIDDDGECPAGPYTVCSRQCGRYALHNRCAENHARKTLNYKGNRYTCQTCRQPVIISPANPPAGDSAFDENAERNAAKAGTPLSWAESKLRAFAPLFLVRLVLWWWSWIRWWIRALLWTALICAVLFVCVTLVAYPYKFVLYSLDKGQYHDGHVRCIAMYNPDTDSIERRCRNYTETHGGVFPSIRQYQFECERRCTEEDPKLCPVSRSRIVQKYLTYSNGLSADWCHVMLGTQLFVAIAVISAIACSCIFCCYASVKMLVYACRTVANYLGTRVIIEGGNRPSRRARRE